MSRRDDTSVGDRLLVSAMDDIFMKRVISCVDVKGKLGV